LSNHLLELKLVPLVVIDGLFDCRRISLQEVDLIVEVSKRLSTCSSREMTSENLAGVGFASRKSILPPNGLLEGDLTAEKELIFVRRMLSSSIEISFFGKEVFGTEGISEKLSI
jgi:hypothetical protein